MRRDGMGRGVARIYARRREVLDRYVPMWLLPGQDGHPAGQDAATNNPLKHKAGQDGQHGTDTKTAIDSNTCAHSANVSPQEDNSRRPVPVHRPQICPVRPVHPVQASNGAGSDWTGRPDADPSILSNLHPWTDDRHWIAEIVRAEPGDPKMANLFWWVIAAGGWIEGTTAKLPALPPGMARNELRRMLRQHGLAVHEAAS